MEVASWTAAQVIGIVFICAGIFLFFSGLLRLLRRNPEQCWCKVPCKIVVSEVVIPEETYRAQIRYTYAFDGQTHQGSRIAPIESWSSFRSTAARFVEKYPVDCNTDAYVNPSDPSCSVLEPQQQPIAAFTEVLAGIAFCYAGYFGGLTASP